MCFEVIFGLILLGVALVGYIVYRLANYINLPMIYFYIRKGRRK